MTATEHALFRSLVHGPLLVEDLPEGATFPYEELVLPEMGTPLNLQQKLGHLYESALAVLLEATPKFDLLARNLQVQRDAQTTVGELDFLVRDLGDGQLIHLELATKFYLAIETEKGLTLPGPDARDNYFRKIRRMREHQLVLAQKYREALPESYRGEAIESRQLVYGCLFDRIEAADRYQEGEDLARVKPAAPEFVNAHCRRGRWLSIDACEDYFPSGTEFRIIPKALWPVSLEFFEGMALEPWTLEESVERCVMVRVNEESMPYFIAPSGYPDVAVGRREGSRDGGAG